MHEQPDGVLFHIHGGAWMAGSPEMMDQLHEIIVDTCRLAVVSVDYRLAPEHPYPAGPDDCEAAACWLLEHAGDVFGSDRLLIGGESAGAHLAAVTLRRMRDAHHAVDRFLGANLVFGAYDLSRTPSQRGVGVPPGRDILDGTGFPLDLFLPGMSDEKRRDPDVSPLYADLHGMPPALFTVGSNDHLLDDTLFMAALGRSRATGRGCSCIPRRRTGASPCRRSPGTSSRGSSTSSASVSRRGRPSANGQTVRDVKWRRGGDISVVHLASNGVRWAGRRKRG